MTEAEATRQVLWNVEHAGIIYVLMIASLAIAGHGLYRRMALWRRGLPDARFDHAFDRAWRLIVHAIAQRRTMRDRWAAFFHAFILYGGIALFIATIVVMVDHRFGVPLMRGAFYLYFQSFLVDLSGALLILGVLIAGFRRLVVRPRRLVLNDESLLILAGILLIAVTGFLLEGWRIAVTADPWGGWSPFGLLVARASAILMSVEAMRGAHELTWWIHAILLFGMIAWIPYTKLIHMVTGPLNIYAASLTSSGASLDRLDFDRLAETGDPMGVKTLSNLTWKDLLDLDACTECGRCTEACPANGAGRAEGVVNAESDFSNKLSPRDLILDLRSLMDRGEFETSITGGLPAASPELLWQCTTCGACMEACPVFIEQMPKIVDLRRFLVMEEADFPETMQDAITSLEARGHPFRGTPSTRLDWMEGLPVRTMAEALEAEVLLWVGCGGALIERNQKVVQATARLLEAAGIDFAVLGREERCTGDPARRIGNEFLFETMARENIEILNRYAVRTIVTSCPHCFNTLRNEYPAFDGKFEVYHHSEYLARLVAEGKLAFGEPVERTVTFHDPCYLGRHNSIFDAPRQLVRISSRRTVEMEERREKAFCCGGGGGMSFMDGLVTGGDRINQERARQVLETGADTVAVGCPFCMAMLEDGINARRGERDVKVFDVAELLLESLSSGDSRGMAEKGEQLYGSQSDS